MLTRCKIRNHITPTLRSLHWLPVSFRIEFKILLLVFKCLHGTAPIYLSNLLNKYTPVRSLRTSNRNLLVVPKTRIKIGESALVISVPIYGTLFLTTYEPSTHCALLKSISKHICSLGLFLDSFLYFIILFLLCDLIAYYVCCCVYCLSCKALCKHCFKRCYINKVLLTCGRCRISAIHGVVCYQLFSWWLWSQLPWDHLQDPPV